MSYTEMFIVKNLGVVVPHAEFKNSHRGAMMIWVNLFNVYCPDQVKEAKERYHMEGKIYPYNDEDYKAVWALAKNIIVPKHNRIVLAATFDYAILEREHFQDYIEAVETYAQDYPQVGHLLLQCKEIAKLQKRKIIGVCWNQTSVSADMWWTEHRRFNINKDGHGWMLFKEMFADSAEGKLARSRCAPGSGLRGSGKRERGGMR